MSVNIPTTGNTSAPTPQNSLASNGTLKTESSVKPSVGRIGEEDEEHGANPASMLANNPNLFDNKFISSRSMGFLDTLSPSIRRRVDGLKGVQQEHAVIESEFQLEILALEKKFAERYAPLYQRRSDIIAGTIEPTDEEVASGQAADEEDDDRRGASITDADEDDKATGIPDFWLVALRNHVGISELITEQDEEALHFLTDIKLSYLTTDKPGFKLTFLFAPNDFFENTELEKTYYYQSEVGYGGDLVYDKAEGTDIKWKEDKDLTKKVEIKKQRNKTTNRTRVVKKVISADSFFNFFKPPMAPSEDAEIDEAELQELDERLELDYQIAEDIKERVIPRAVDYFSGKALQYDGLDDLDDEDDEFDEDDYQSDDDDEEMHHSHPAPGTSQDPQECKQQ